MSKKDTIVGLPRWKRKSVCHVPNSRCLAGGEEVGLSPGEREISWWSWRFGSEGNPSVRAVASNEWLDGVYQTEMKLIVDVLHRVTETQRQLSSCPVLFAWEGEKGAFVNDLAGVGDIGFAVGPGEEVHMEFAVPQGSPAA